MDENPIEVVAIRRLWFKTDHPADQIARMVGVSVEYVYSVVRSETHFHPPYKPEQPYPSRSKQARQVGSSSRNCSMLTMDEAREIRALWVGSQHTAQEISELYSLSRGMVYKIVNNQVKALHDASYIPPRRRLRKRRPRATLASDADDSAALDK